MTENKRQEESGRIKISHVMSDQALFKKEIEPGQLRWKFRFIKSIIFRRIVLPNIKRDLLYLDTFAV
jgi:hypothetical protein